MEIIQFYALQIIVFLSIYTMPLPFLLKTKMSDLSAFREYHSSSVRSLWNQATFPERHLKTDYSARL